MMTVLSRRFPKAHNCKTNKDCTRDKWDTMPKQTESDAGFCLRKRIRGGGEGGGQPAASKIGKGAPLQPACWGNPNDHPTLRLTKKLRQYFFLAARSAAPKKNTKTWNTYITYIYNTKYYFALENRRAIFACRITIWVV